MDMAAMTSALAASPRAHLLSASYSPLRASALQARTAASGEVHTCTERTEPTVMTHLNVAETTLNQTGSFDSTQTACWTGCRCT